MAGWVDVAGWMCVVSREGSHGNIYIYNCIRKVI